MIRLRTSHLAPKQGPPVVPVRGTPASLVPCAANPVSYLHPLLAPTDPKKRIIVFECSADDKVRLEDKAMTQRAAPRTVLVNRAPVMTLWASVVAERLGFDRDEALSLGRAVAGLNAQSKGWRIGVFKPHEE
jgi:hypothetical protein